MANTKPRAKPKATPAPAAKRGKGRPSSYKPEYAEQAYKLCLLGATDESMANFFNVCVATIDNWKNDHSDFLGAIKEGKEGADAKVAQSLYNQAIGYTGKKVVTATHMGAITDEKEVPEYVGPNATAAIFWLKNRQPKQWRDKQEVDHTGMIATANVDVTPEQEDVLRKVLMSKYGPD